MILTGRNPERLQRAASELDALSTATFDANDPAPLEQFFRDLPATIDHVMVTAGRAALRTYARYGLRAGAPRSRQAPLADAPGRPQRRAQSETGRHAAVHGRHRRPPPGIGLGIASTVTAALPALTANLALELAPVRVNLIAAGFVDTPLSATLLGDELESRRKQLRDHASYPARCRSRRTLPRSPYTS